MAFLSAGSRLGPYEILFQLGKGGMGEVFLARDTRLDRRVACQSLGDRRGIGWCLQTIAMVEAGDNRASRAATIYGSADALLKSIGATDQVTVTRVQDRYLSLAMQALGTQRSRTPPAKGG